MSFSFPIINKNFTHYIPIFCLKSLDDVDKFHEEVFVYEVTDIDNNYIGLLYQDIHLETFHLASFFLFHYPIQDISIVWMHIV